MPNHIYRGTSYLFDLELLKMKDSEQVTIGQYFDCLKERADACCSWLAPRID